MGDVLTFTPRSRSPEPASPVPLTGAALRASLEEAAQTALDAADRIIAVLDGMDGDADDEDGADAEPSLAAPEIDTESQVAWMHGGDQAHETAALEATQLEVTSGPMSAPIVLPWHRRGNVISAAGIAFLNMVGI